jgi:hypothetical protein
MGEKPCRDERGERVRKRRKGGQKPKGTRGAGRKGKVTGKRETKKGSQRSTMDEIFTHWIPYKKRNGLYCVGPYFYFNEEIVRESCVQYDSSECKKKGERRKMEVR